MTDLATQLLDWYDRNKRNLPWRATGDKRPDPYAVWLSEVMLQQTTVATVKGYFEKFLNRWPTVTALAAATQEDVLQEWAGLGYYSRARNLHKCAQVVTTEHDGTFPSTEAALRALPGIGDYTAAAIASIAFDEPATVVDGNVERVISRLHRVQEKMPTAKKAIKELAAELTPQERAGDYAQATMDLGATICSPKKPKCLLCPWVKACAAHKAGDEERYPIKAPKKLKPTRRAISFWLEHDGHILLERRPQKGLLAGMPGLFSTPWIERDNFPEVQEWQAHVPVDSYWKKTEDMAKHTFTHFHLETRLLTAKSSQKLNIENGFWHPINDIKNIGLPTVFDKIVKLKP